MQQWRAPNWILQETNRSRGKKKSNNLIKVPDLHNGRSMAASERGAADGERGAHAHHRPATAGIRAAVQNLPSRWHFLRQLQQ